MGDLALKGIAPGESIFAADRGPCQFGDRVTAVSGLVLAVRYLTILPVPGRPHAPLERLGRAAPWFPLVGAGLGVVLVAADALTVWLFPPLLAALLTVTLWKLLTGGLHLDGLADCLDGLVGRDRERRLAIMRDSRIGTFGAVGLILFLMLEIVAVAELVPDARRAVLLAAPSIGRAAPPVLARLFPAARPEGQGAAFRAGVGPLGAALAAALGALVALAALGAAGLAVMALALTVAAAAARFVTGRLGGLTGDVLGAAVEVAELTALLAVIAWTRVRA
jgi:adenosylcobinamide-GDP ribazoletransferase